MIGVTAVIYIFIIPEEPLGIKIVFKLIPMILIIFYAFTRLPAISITAHRLVIMGLFFCILGDAFIAVSFTAGLGAFLIGHLFYLSGFLKVSLMDRMRLASILPILLYSFIMGSKIISSLLADGNQMLIIPVIAYILAISLMALSAIQTRNIRAIFGSILFVISDSILSWNMFVSDITHSGVFIMTTYYFAQFLIASSLTTLWKNAGHNREIDISKASI
ncbi:lysoplasmalogenase [Bacillus sp. UNCCL13]|nr:lysoplasmalogenase [Bacillus sp. UNCCL13]